MNKLQVKCTAENLNIIVDSVIDTLSELHGVEKSIIIDAANAGNEKINSQIKELLSTIQLQE